jgi:hypothetical protein
MTSRRRAATQKDDAKNGERRGRQRSRAVLEREEGQDLGGPRERKRGLACYLSHVRPGAFQAQVWTLDSECIDERLDQFTLGIGCPPVHADKKGHPPSVVEPLEMPLQKCIYLLLLIKEPTFSFLDPPNKLTQSNYNRQITPSHQN